MCFCCSNFFSGFQNIKSNFKGMDSQREEKNLLHQNCYFFFLYTIMVFDMLYGVIMFISIYFLLFGISLKLRFMNRLSCFFFEQLLHFSLGFYSVL